MKCVPKAKPNQLKNVKAGHLFLFYHGNRTYYCLKCFAKQMDNNILDQILFLGPNLPQQFNGMMVSTPTKTNAVVLDYGREFIVEYDASPDKIMFHLPGIVVEGNGLILAGNHHYIRANNANREPLFSACYVCVETGEILYELTEPVPVMVTAWSIRLAATDDLQVEQIPDPIVRVAFPPPQ